MTKLSVLKKVFAEKKIKRKKKHYFNTIDPLLHSESQKNVELSYNTTKWVILSQTFLKRVITHCD